MTIAMEMLPAREGDCLLLEWPDTKKRTRRALIDGGRKATWKAVRTRLEAIPKDERELELLVVTHVDRDHIEGVIEMLADPKPVVTFKEIWFNGFAHLQDPEQTKEDFGGVMGEALTQQLLSRKKTWNASWKGRAACVRDGGLETITLPGGMSLTILSPDAEKMAELVPDWQKECKKAGLVPGATKPPKGKKGVENFGAIDLAALASEPFEEDDSTANGSSIGLLAEHRDGGRVLLGADCHVDRLEASLKLLKPKGRLKVDAFKLPHHGSSHNVTKGLLEKLDCDNYLVSTNGSYFQHPTRSAIARVILHGGKKPRLHFNYRSDFTQSWPGGSAKHPYQAVFPDSKSNGTLRMSFP
jgi:beta-lactamase superfamily II metal-dependent hydrolase